MEKSAVNQCIKTGLNYSFRICTSYVLFKGPLSQVSQRTDKINQDVGFESNLCAMNVQAEYFKAILLGFSPRRAEGKSRFQFKRKLKHFVCK